MPDPEKSAAERFFRIDDLLRNVFEQLGDNEVRKVFTINQRALVVGVDVMQSRKSMSICEAMKRGYFHRYWYIRGYRNRYHWWSLQNLRLISNRAPIAIRERFWEGRYEGPTQLDYRFANFIKAKLPHLQRIFTPDNAVSPNRLDRYKIDRGAYQLSYDYVLDFDANSLDIKEHIQVVKPDAGNAVEYLAAPASLCWGSFSVRHTIAITFNHPSACTPAWLDMIRTDPRVVAPYIIIKNDPPFSIATPFAKEDDPPVFDGTILDQDASNPSERNLATIQRVLKSHATSRTITADAVTTRELACCPDGRDMYLDWERLGPLGQLATISSMSPVPLGFHLHILHRAYRFHAAIPNSLVECRIPLAVPGDISDLWRLVERHGPTLDRLEVISMPSYQLNLAGVINAIRGQTPALRHLDIAWARKCPSEGSQLRTPKYFARGTLDSLTLRMEDSFRESDAMVSVAKLVSALCTKSTRILITGRHCPLTCPYPMNGCNCVIRLDFMALVRWLVGLSVKQAAAMNAADFKRLEVHDLDGSRRWEQLEFDEEDKPIPLISVENLELVDRLIYQRDGNGPRTALQASRTLAYLRERLLEDSRARGTDEPV